MATTPTTNTANTTVTDRTSSGIKPDGTPAVGTVATSGASGVTSIISGSTNVSVVGTGSSPGTGDVTISVTGGTGTVTGPSSSTDEDIALFNGTTGTVIKDSGLKTSAFISSTATQTANTVLAGPASGSAAAPSFRAIVPADVPTLNQNTTGNAGSVTGLSVTATKTLTATNTLTLSGTDGSTLNVGTGGTLGTAAYTASSSYVAASGGTATNLTLSGTLTAGSSVGSSGQVLSSLGTGGVQWTTPSSGFTNPMTTLGDIIYENATPAPARLPGNTTTTKKYLSQTGTGSVSATPAWSQVAASDVSGLAASATTDTTNAGNISTGNLSNSRLTNASANTILGNNTGSTASPSYNSLSSYIDNIGSAQGDILYRGASNWSVLTPGTSGQVLQTNGASANPSWATVSGSLPSGTQGQALLYGASGGVFKDTIINVGTYSSVSTAEAAAYTAGAAIYVPQGTWSISSLTVRVPIYIDGTLSCTGTCTFNGTVNAPLKQVFSGGTVVIGNKTPYIYPEWFGATKNGSADDQPALNSALNAVTLASGSSSPIQHVVLSGTYYLGSSLTVSNSQMFKVVAGASFYPYGSYTGDCLIYQYSTNNTVTDIPTIYGFTTGAGLKILGCSVMKATGFMIKNCKYGVYIKGFAGSAPHAVLDNYIDIHFIPDCQYGFYITDDSLGAVIQGNELYCNFYTNDNTYANPWVSGGTTYTGVSTVALIPKLYTVITSLGTLTNDDWNTIAGTTGATYIVGSHFIAATSIPYSASKGTGGTVTQYVANSIAAVYYDSTNLGNWDGNNIEVLVIDLNGGTNSWGFYNASVKPINGWLLRCDNWFGGINGNAPNWVNGFTYQPGSNVRDQTTGNVYALKDTSAYTSATQPSSDTGHWAAAGTYEGNIFSTSFITGYFQACTMKFLMRGDLTQPQWGTCFNMHGEYNRVEFRNGGAGSSSPIGQPALQTSSGSRTSFNYYPIFQNRYVCSYTFPFDFGVNSVATFYAYAVSADGYTSGSGAGASNCLNAINLNGIGISIDAIYDNGAVSQNEIVIKARNVSGSVIPTGTQWTMMLVAGI